MTITATSVAIALVIGGLEGLGLLVDKLGLQGGLWRGVEVLNDHMGSVGYAAIALFVVLWALSALNYRRKNYDSLTL
ncbi:High-affinity nickel transport protein [compost metagenome]|jgi:high-affinity nickel-transport protein